MTPSWRCEKEAAESRSLAYPLKLHLHNESSFSYSFLFFFFFFGINLSLAFLLAAFALARVLVQRFVRQRADILGPLIKQPHGGVRAINIRISAWIQQLV